MSDKVKRKLISTSPDDSPTKKKKKYISKRDKYLQRIKDLVSDVKFDYDDVKTLFNNHLEKATVPQLLHALSDIRITKNVNEAINALVMVNEFIPYDKYEKEWESLEITDLLYKEYETYLKEFTRFRLLSDDEKKNELITIKRRINLIDNGISELNMDLFFSYFQYLYEGDTTDDLEIVNYLTTPEQ